MATLTFFISPRWDSKTKKYLLNNRHIDESKPVVIRLRYYNVCRLNALTTLFIEPKYWDNATEGIEKKIAAKVKLDAEKGYSEARTLFDNFNQIGNTLFSLRNYLNKELNKVNSTNLPKDYLQKIVDLYFKDLSVREATDENLNDYIARYIKEIKEGERLTNKNTTYAAGTIQNRVSFQSEFNKFQIEKGLTLTI